MTSRERELKALNHEEPDRVPLDLGGTRNSGILLPAYRNLLALLGFDDEASGPEHEHSKLLGLVTPSEAVLERLNIDFRGITLGKADRSNETLLADGSHRDEFGVIRRQPDGVPYWELTGSPFSGAVSVADLYRWP